MRRSRSGVLGSLLLVVAAAAGCGAHPRTATPALGSADVAGTATDAVPRWCAELSTSRSIADLPEDLGRLAADPWDVVAHEDITEARSYLGDLLDTLRAGHAPEAATTALHDLVAALGTFGDAHPSADAAERVSHDLATVGQVVQPVCEFPT